MKSRLLSVLGTLFLIAVFGFGAFLFVAAEEVPAPGVILMGVSGALLLRRFFGRGRGPGRQAASQHSESPFTGSRQALDSYDYDMERRRRGDSDVDPQTSDR